MNTPLQNLLKDGFRLHQAGQLADAADLYKKVLDQDPNNADALDLLGTIFYASGNMDMAISMAQAAIAAQPTSFAPHVNLGNAFQATGRLSEAVAAFQASLNLNPKNPHAANNLASALNALGRYDSGEKAARTALKITPDMAEAYNNLGKSQAGLNDKSAAIESFKTAVEINADLTESQYNLGTLLLEINEPRQAIGPLKISIELDPQSAEKTYNLGNVYQEIEQFEDAIACYRTALRLKPDYTDALSNLGTSLQAEGRLDEAITTFRQALNLEVNSADLHWNLSLALIQNGDFEEGWQEHEWRWQNPAFKEPRRDFTQPRWQGEALNGKTVLIHAEQGFGDAIMFARYAPLVAAKGGRVVLECRKPLKRLFESLEGVSELVVRDAPLPDFDCYIPHNSLPGAMGTTLSNIPADVPYLRPPEDVQANPLLSKSEGFKVGLVWAGSPTNANDKNRSCPIEHFKALMDMPGVDIFSLQLGDHACSDKVSDLAPSLVDFAHTAAAIDTLDLVISVDTAVAHLAGAMGKPIWVLLPQAVEWRWLQNRDDSPWYPTMKLFRQKDRGDWPEVFKRVTAELSKLLVS